MILVTVGGQMPFDRLVLAVDRWAGQSGRRDVLAQIGRGGTPPECLDWVPLLNPGEFREHVKRADVVVAHAGMGTILTCLVLGTPVLVMPRWGRLQETRNDHQVATAARLSGRGLVSVAEDEHSLPSMLDRLHEVVCPPSIGPHADSGLLAALREFTHQPHANNDLSARR